MEMGTRMSRIAILLFSFYQRRIYASHWLMVTTHNLPEEEESGLGQTFGKLELSRAQRHQILA